MSAKTIWIIIGLVVLVFIAGQPLGQMISAIGHALVTVGGTIQNIGVKVHG